MMEEKVFKIFSDFDGTITVQDVGAAFVHSFGIPEKVDTIVRDWIDGKITSPESWYLMLDTIEEFTEGKFDKFLEDMHIEPTFHKFVEYCNGNSYELRVLSDGLDIYIRRLFEREGLNGFDIFCNRAVIDNNKVSIVFPYGDEECRLCGNCKRNHILTNSGDDEFIVYIGDGYSDKCPIEYCDFVFAKDSLLKYCEINRITYFPFSDFNDVIKRLEELKKKKRLKKKHQAVLKRRETFMQG